MFNDYIDMSDVPLISDANTAHFYFLISKTQSSFNHHQGIIKIIGMGYILCIYLLQYQCSIYEPGINGVKLKDEIKMKSIKPIFLCTCLLTVGIFSECMAKKPAVNVSTFDSNCVAVQSSGGSVDAALENFTRPVGISPETVYFSAQQSTDPACEDFSGGNDLEACRTGQYFGYHFDFDDPDSGVFSVTGNSKNNQVSGAPRAVHTFVCEGKGNSRWNEVSQQCEFAVKVRVQNPAGDWDDACVDVSIRPQAVEYATTETYCVSNDSDFTDCPAGVPVANRLTDSPPQNLQTDLSHSRILYQRGSAGMYSPMCIGYDEKNIRIDAYGMGADPLIEEVIIGTASGCQPAPGSFNNDQASGYDVLTKNAAGHVISGWAYGHGAANLRLRNLTVGMAATLLTLHNLDLDWSDGGSFSVPRNGYVRMGSTGWNCYSNDNLNCDLVPHPYGIFVSEVRSVGEVSDEGVVRNIPDLNFACFNDCGLINSAIIGSYGKAAFEHNLRIMGAWGLVVSNSHFAGDHAGNRGPKSKVTLRQIVTNEDSSQVVNPENFITGNHAGNGPGWERNDDPTQHFSPHYNFLIDNMIGDTVNARTEDAPWFEFRAGHQYSSVFGTEFLFWPAAELNPSQLFLGGRNITAHGTSYNGANTTWRFNNDVFANPSFYYDDSAIFSDAPDGRCNGAFRSLPVPLQPGEYKNDLIFADGFE